MDRLLFPVDQQLAHLVELLVDLLLAGQLQLVQSADVVAIGLLHALEFLFFDVFHAVL